MASSAERYILSKYFPSIIQDTIGNTILAPSILTFGFAFPTTMAIFETYSTILTLVRGPIGIQNRRPALLLQSGRMLQVVRPVPVTGLLLLTW